MFDFIAVSGTMEDRMIEYVDHLHEHFLDPCRLNRGRYYAPAQPGYSITMKPESLGRHRFPDGEVWLR
jgi:L-fuconate dehydratase